MLNNPHIKNYRIEWERSLKDDSTSCVLIIETDIILDPFKTPDNGLDSSALEDMIQDATDTADSNRIALDHIRIVQATSA